MELPSDWQARHLQWAENIAGARYDSVLDVDVDLATVFAGLGRTDEFRDALASVGNRLDAVFKYGLRGGEPAEIELVFSVTKSVAAEMRGISSSAVEAHLDYTQVLEDAQSGIDSAWTAKTSQRDAERGKDASRTSDFVLHDANRAADLLAEAVELLQSRDARAANEQLLLLTGPAGAGKTHMLVHMARERAAKGLHSIVLFGDQFSELEDVRSFSSRLGVKSRFSFEDILDALEILGSTAGSRAMLLVDGVNETSPCGIWQEGLKWLERALLDRPHVCAVVSVRDGFQDSVAKRETLDSVLLVEHHGFARNLWQAVQMFFAHYQVQWPEVPLLGPEFANPLFLKLFCTAFAGETPRSFRGHAGGTHIFEAYAKKVGPAINDELEAPEMAGNYCWSALVKPLATWMGENGVQEISVDEAVRTAEEAYPGRGTQALVSMEQHALIMKSVRVARSGEERDYVYRFSYQKFSDHLIVRFLLNSHFDPDSPAPADAFAPTTRLGQIATLAEGRGLLEALAAQVPERTNGAQELIDYVPDEVARSRMMIAAFLDSLIWRKPDAIGQSAIDYINGAAFDDTRRLEDLFEVLLSVASMPDYRLNARALHRLLESWSLPDRDQVWTSWLRYQYVDEGSAVDRLVSWARRAPGRDKVAPEAALLTAVALCWLFVSPNRFLRDDATKAAVALLENHPGAVAELIRMFEAVDDPYVLERVLCVAYGALARRPDAEALAAAAVTLLDGFFTRRDCTHILTRDYARETVDLAVRAGVIEEERAEQARPPYGSPFPEDVPSKDELKARYADADGYVSDHGSIWHSVMEWDFGWYIIGTNSGSTPWSNRRLGDPLPPTLEERWERFRLSLSSEVQQAFEAWEESKSIDSMRMLVGRLRYADTSEPDQAEPQEPSMRAQLLDLLTEDQQAAFEALMASREDRVRDDTFDLRIEQSWVFLRCLELGWTKERFGTVESERGWNYHDTRKTERIGKKYQWIAHFEFLGLLADNYALRPAWGSSESPDYRGPWQDFLRDIDPTCLADGLPHQQRSSACSPASYDPDASSSDDAEWLGTLEDLVDPGRVIECLDADGEPWLALEGFFEWRSSVAPGVDQFSILHRHVWYQVQGYLLAADQAPAFVDWAYSQNFMGRWMPENRSISEVYLREYPNSLAFTDLLEESADERTGWVREIRGSDLEIPLLVATDSYSASSSDRDCSVKESFTITLPAHSLVREMSMVHGPDDGTWTVDGQLAALDPSVDSDVPGVLLVRRSALQSYLERSGLALVWTVMAAKELSGGWDDRKDRLPRAGVNAAFWLKPDGIEGRMWAGEADTVA